MRTYDITIARTGNVQVEANSEEEAMKVANNLPENIISWADDWNATDAEDITEYEEAEKLNNSSK